MTRINRYFLSDLEELQKDNGLTNKNRKAWRSSENYQIQSQQKAVPSKRRGNLTLDLPCSGILEHNQFIMRTNRFVLWLGLLVVATLSVGALAFLLLRREGDKMRDNAEQSRLMADEATSRAKLYHEMAKQSRTMAEYAEKAAEDSLAIRARTVADNMDLTMSDLKEGLMSGLRALPTGNRTEELSSWTSSNTWVDKCFVWGAKEGLSFPVGKDPADLSPLRDGAGWVWEQQKGGFGVPE